MKPKYKQPYNLRIYDENPELQERMREREHGRLKYKAKYQRNKYSRRMK